MKALPTDTGGHAWLRLAWRTKASAPTFLTLTLSLRQSTSASPFLSKKKL